jgi:uncharacterized small protein (DUF1192 family)
MTDTPTEPVEQVVTAPPQQAPAGFIELARYNGLVRKVEELTLGTRTLNEQLAAQTSELEQLRAQLVVKDAEKSAAVSQRDGQIQETIKAKTELERELNDLRGLKTKVEVIREMKRPDLLKIADQVPNLTDPEALKTVLASFASFADEAASEREKQLLAGVTPGVGAAAKASTAPASDKAWMEHIESLPLGSPERAKAFYEYGNWLNETHK